MIELLEGNAEQIHTLLRMKKYIFLQLCDTFKERGLLKNKRGTSVDEQMVIFLMTLGHNERNQVMQEMF